MIKNLFPLESIHYQAGRMVQTQLLGGSHKGRPEKNNLPALQNLHPTRCAVCASLGSWSNMMKAITEKALALVDTM